MADSKTVLLRRSPPPAYISARYRRIFTSLFLAVIFAWFALNPPQEQGEETSIRLDNPGQQAFLPKLVADEPEQPASEFGLVSLKTGKDHDFKLVTEKEDSTVSDYGLIADGPMNIAAAREQMAISGRRYEPDGFRLEIKRDAPVAYGVRVDSDRQYQGLYLDNQGLWNEVKGFAGSISLGVYIDAAGRIRKLVHLDSDETPSYLRRIEKAGFYDQFRGLSLTNEHFEVDAVTGATVTTEAIGHTLSALVDDAAESPLEEYLSSSVQGFSVSAHLTDVWILHALVIGALFAFFWQKWLRRNRLLRTLVGVTSLLYIGFWLNNSFTYVTLIHPFLGVSISAFAAVYAGLVLIGAVWDNNTYCKYVCPFGIAQRFAQKIDRTLHSCRWHHWPLGNRAMYILRLWLAVILLAGIHDGLHRWLGFELFPDFFDPDYTNVWWQVSLAVVLWLSVRVPNLWCRLLCPTGALLDLLSDAMYPGKLTRKLFAGKSRGQRAK